MRTIHSFFGLILITGCFFTSCSEKELPDHFLDVEFKYELICSDVLLKYVTPEVTFTNEKGQQIVIKIDSSMWEGSEHKKWVKSIHYDRLDVSNIMSVRYIPRADATYQDEPEFDNVHNLSCFIFTREDGKGQRNKYTIIPDYPAVTNVNADALRNYINQLSQSSIIRGGVVDLKGEINTIENN